MEMNGLYDAAQRERWPYGKPESNGEEVGQGILGLPQRPYNWYMGSR